MQRNVTAVSFHLCSRPQADETELIELTEPASVGQIHPQGQARPTSRFRPGPRFAPTIPSRHGVGSDGAAGVPAASAVTCNGRKPALAFTDSWRRHVNNRLVLIACRSTTRYATAPGINACSTILVRWRPPPPPFAAHASLDLLRKIAPQPRNRAPSANTLQLERR